MTADRYFCLVWLATLTAWFLLGGCSFPVTIDLKLPELPEAGVKVPVDISLPPLPDADLPSEPVWPCPCPPAGNAPPNQNQ